jgi:hypothetical protein
VTFTATVTANAPSTATPTGKVDFKINNVDMTPGGVNLDTSGQAAFQITNLDVPTTPYTVTVDYTNSDGNFTNTSGSLAGRQAVNKANTTTTFSAFNSRPLASQVNTYTVTVNPVAPGSGTRTNTVTFFVDGAPRATKALNGSFQASFSVAFSTLGGHTVTAQYNGDGNFNRSSATAKLFVIQLPSVSVAFGPHGKVLAVVSPHGILTQYDIDGPHVLGGGVRAAGVAFGPFGETMLVTFLTGRLVEFDARGARTLRGGVQSASVAFGPFGEVMLVTRTDNTLMQYDVFGAHLLDRGVQSASIAFGPGGEVVDVITQSGLAFHYSVGGVQALGGKAVSISQAFGPFGGVVEVIIKRGYLLYEFDVTGVHFLFQVI